MKRERAYKKTPSTLISALRRLCRVFFSRYAISALVIAAEVALMTFLILRLSYDPGVTSYVTLGTVAIPGLITFILVLNRDANPEYKVTWTAIVLLLPVFGALIYFLFYNRRMTRGESMRLRGIFTEIRNYRSTEVLDELRTVDSLAAGKAQAIMAEDYISEVYRDSASVFFPSGESYFESLLSDLSSAKSYIFLEYFIIEQGELWDSIHGILKQKAADGLDIRLLYDDIGCMRTLPSNYEHLLRSEGIKAFRFAKVSPRVTAAHNNRDHRKICIIDGAVGYTGGVNIADEYVNRKLRFGHWKDGGIRLSGLAVAGLVRLFLSSWDFTTGAVSDYEAIFSSVKPAVSGDGGFYLPFGSGPAPIYRRPVGKDLFMNLINQAERYISITTPYLIIDYDLTEALCNAAVRGVEVRIITPHLADKRLVKIMTKSSYPHLMRSGVRIFEYTPGFIHEKTVVVDGLYAVVGTLNFDWRSFVHHFEDGVWMYRTPTVDVAREEFEKTISKCEEIDSRRSRLTLIEWIFRNGIKLFAPLL